MNAGDAAKMLDLIAERAQILRERGVRRIELGDVAFTLAEPEHEAPAQEAARRADEAPTDAFLDPTTYGLPDRDSDGTPRQVARRRRAPLVEPGT